MNIGLLSKTFGLAAGGIESYTACLSRNLAALGHTVHVFAIGDDAATVPVGDRVFLHTIKFSEPSFSGAWHLEKLVPYAWLAYARQVRRRIAALPAGHRLQVLESPNWGLDGFWSEVFRDLPVVVRLHVPTPDYAQTGVLRYRCREKTVLLLERLFLVRADVVTSPSHHLAVRAREAYGLDRTVAVIPNGIDISEARPQERPESPRPTVLYAGRIERNKGIEALLQAAPEVLARVPRAEFVLAGRIVEKEDVMRQWRSVAPGAVRFTGELSRPELIDLYRQSWVCVMPSLSEAFGLTALEAMACGKPVVASAVGGLTEIVDDGQNGLLVGPGDCAALKSAVVTLLKDRKYRCRLGANARRTVRERFDPGMLAAATLRVYEEAIRSFSRAGNGRAPAARQERGERNAWNDIHVR